MTLYHGPIRAPLPRDLDWRDQSWRSRIGGRGMVGGLYPGYGFRDFAGGRLVTDDGINSLPVVTPSAEMGIAWDFSGSKTATMGNWGNEFWSGTTAQFSITLIIDRFVVGTSCIIAKADSNGMMWEIFDISTSGNLGLLAWYVRGAGGAYLEMITNTPPAGVVHTDRPNVITVSVNMALSGSSRMRVYINGVDVSTSVTESGDMSGGIANNASEVILGYWNPTNQYYWPGKLGGLWFHNRVLSAEEIQILHGQMTRYSFLPVHDDDYIPGAPGSLTPSMTAGVASLVESSTGNTVVLTGINTAWTPGTPGSPTFSISTTGSGAAITAQVVDSPTQATLTVDAGTGIGDTITITDPLNGISANIAIVGAAAFTPFFFNRFILGRRRR